MRRLLLPALASAALLAAACSGGSKTAGGGIEVPLDTPSRQTVTFQIANTTSGDLYVITGGSFCDPFGVDRSGTGGVYQRLQLELGFQCGCECPQPPEATAVGFHRIAAGSSYAISWDARELHAVATTQSCPSGPDATVYEGGSQPVPAGGYRVDLGFSVPPAGCVQSGDDWTCSASAGGTMPPPIQATCAASATVSRTFALPANGDLTVPVPVP